ncbi:hypothetical protein GGR34_003313 [Microvirga flocculans]|uniref:Restriction endonuclease n=1 Tax=Microvirga flocculans TaxID=217168 RepID=A0A7W6IIR7_9HYPH|nr:hypothetical protein [Microvirga flocculans]MBB4041635.1 hypothetical protein [Microvirga flocculans]
MAIFSRRTLQTFLNELAPRLDDEARKKILSSLNGRKASVALGFEWELIVLTLLNRIGSVRYEPDLGASRRPDVLFSSDDEQPIHFLADITTVTDEGLEEDNPVLKFSAFLREKASKLGIPGGFNYDVRGQRDAAGKMRLMLPRERFREFLESRVTPELKRIQREKPETHRFDIEEPPDVSFSIGYDAREKFWSGHYPSYVAASSADQNSVFSALKKKARQLKESIQDSSDPAEASAPPLGIVLCDGNCRLLQLDASGQISLPRVIGRFFEQTTSISFVLALTFPPVRLDMFGAHQDHMILGTLYSNPRARAPIDHDHMLDLLNRGLGTLPQPIATPAAALGWMERRPNPYAGKPFSNVRYGVQSIMGGVNNVKISARLVLDLLAGEITAAELAEKTGQPNDPDWLKNPFLHAVKAGQLIKDIKVSRDEHNDDDWLEIEFVSGDPAVSRFRIDE